MKNLILTLIFFISGLVYSQDLPIMENDWYLTELIVNGQTYSPPSNEEIEKVWMRIYEEPEDFFWFESQSCDLLMGLLSWVNEYGISFHDFAGGYACTMPENVNFDKKYAEFYGHGGTGGTPFYYDISENSDGSLTLIVADLNGNTATYSNKTMSTTDVFSDAIKLSPNPFTDRILLSGVHQRGLTAYVIDLQRRTVMNNVSVDINNREINLSGLKQGVYLFVLKDSNNRILHKQKIIKK